MLTNYYCVSPKFNCAGLCRGHVPNSHKHSNLLHCTAKRGIEDVNFLTQQIIIESETVATLSLRWEEKIVERHSSAKYAIAIGVGVRI